MKRRNKLWTLQWLIQILKCSILQAIICQCQDQQSLCQLTQTLRPLTIFLYFVEVNKIRLEKMILEMTKMASKEAGRRKALSEFLMSCYLWSKCLQSLNVYLHLSWSKTKQSGMNSYFTSTSRKKLHIFDPKSAIIECLSSPLPDSVEATKHLIQTAMNSFFSHLLHTWGKKLIWHHGKWCLLLFNHWFAHLLKR